MLLLDLLIATLVLFPPPADEIWYALTRGTAAASFEPSALRFPLLVFGLVALAVRGVRSGQLREHAAKKVAWCAAALAAAPPAGSRCAAPTRSR